MIKWLNDINNKIDKWFDEEHSIYICDSYIEINNYTLLVISLIALLIIRSVIY